MRFSAIPGSIIAANRTHKNYRFPSASPQPHNVASNNARHPRMRTGQSHCSGAVGSGLVFWNFVRLLADEEPHAGLFLLTGSRFRQITQAGRSGEEIS
jgi:hypothetical protein